MVIGEDSNFNYTWECSTCKSVFKDTRKFEKSKVCPVCDAVITVWLGMDNCEED